MSKRKILRFNENKVLEVSDEEEKPKVSDQESRNKFLAMMSLASQLGFSISLPIAGGAVLGRFLDGRFDSSPKITLSLIFFGLFIGATNIYFVLKESQEK